MTAHPKPQPPRREPVKVYADGRVVYDIGTISGRRAYEGNTYAMAVRQEFKCAICGEIFSQWHPATFDHQNGRGSGGAIRDDRILIDGEWFNAALCVPCQGVKGSRRYHWVTIDAKLVYVPVERGER